MTGLLDPVDLAPMMRSICQKKVYIKICCQEIKQNRRKSIKVIHYHCLFLEIDFSAEAFVVERLSLFVPA